MALPRELLDLYLFLACLECIYACFIFVNKKKSRGLRSDQSGG